MLNEVNHGAIDWEDFVGRSIANIKYLETQLDENGEEYIKRVQDDEKRKKAAIRNGECVEAYTGEEQPNWESIDG